VIMAFMEVPFLAATSEGLVDKKYVLNLKNGDVSAPVELAFNSLNLTRRYSPL
jgi:hypothetical protein